MCGRWPQLPRFRAEGMNPGTARRPQIYGGYNGFFDYGPLGAELKSNLKKMWWRRTGCFSMFLPSWRVSIGDPAPGPREDTPANKKA